MKKFVVVIPSYKNSQWHARNLSSVCAQNYEQFRVIYIDDFSPDDTANLVETWLQQNKMSHKVTLIKNETRKGALENLYNAIHSCADDEIIVTLDGDDWFAHSQVISKLNTYYSDPNVWITWGSYMDHPQNSRGCSKPIPPQVHQSNNYRRSPWCTSHLRTFYKWLFANIKKEDLLAPDGTFWNSAWDLAFMIPMIEMAGFRSKYIHDILYIYNNENPIQDYKVRLQEQQNFERLIRAKKTYNRI